MSSSPRKSVSPCNGIVKSLSAASAVMFAALLATTALSPSAIAQTKYDFCEGGVLDKGNQEKPPLEPELKKLEKNISERNKEFNATGTVRRPKMKSRG
jgi:hypothetical protein